MATTVMQHKAAILTEIASGLFHSRDRTAERKILIATNDFELRSDLNRMLEMPGTEVIWVRTLEEAKYNLTRKNIAACLSGFWLVDGTYRDVVRYMTNHASEIPLIVLCPKGCSQDQYEFLSNLNTGAFRFLSHPYQPKDVQEMLLPDIGANAQATLSVDSDLSSPSADPLAFPVLRRAT